MKEVEPPKIGSRFGHLTVIDNTIRIGIRNDRACVCKCDCGTIVTPLNKDLRSGHTKSCGCRNGYRITPKNKANGESKTKLYAVWSSMLKRCYDAKDSHYPNYGGRGISVCDSWKNSFLSFKDWALSNGYSDGLSIDRIDVNGNYNSENCRWATQKQQANNRRSNTLITYKGKTQSVSMWANEKHIGVTTLLWRLKNWSDIELILNEPIEHKFSPHKKEMAL